jgi:acetyltransferase-like isoleucine patch superfamily enzyme
MDSARILESATPEVRNLFDQLQLLKSSLSRGYAKQFDRSLPFGEMLSDRWEKAKELSFGEGTSIYDDTLVFGKVKVGRNTWIGPFVVLDGSGGLEIGDFCSISSGVQIYSHNTVKWALSGGKMQYEYKATSIGSNCFIGPMCIIQNGVSVGSNSVIGANSFVNADVPPLSIAAGNPAKVIGKVEISNGDVRLIFS